MMKNLLTAIVLGIALAGFALAQTSSRQQTATVKAAVVEFSPGENVSGMTPEAKRQIQASMAFVLRKTNKIDLVDVRWTRQESEKNLAEINGGSSTAAAVKLGKTLGVSYVLTGIVTEYTLKGADGHGRVVFKTRLIEVATGKIKHETETAQRTAKEMRIGNYVELQTMAVKPAVEKIAATLAELF